ncbi:hypothetical protein B0H19DRAFT_1062595 [Mycena capillaripes]|nr:hypothetical protein B0H19DRAFT_1062595 [Mycena capillaripes]
MNQILETAQNYSLPQSKQNVGQEDPSEKPKGFKPSGWVVSEPKRCVLPLGMGPKQIVFPSLSAARRRNDRPEKVGAPDPLHPPCIQSCVVAPAAVHAAQDADSHLRDVQLLQCCVRMQRHTACHHMWRKLNGVGGVGLLAQKQRQQADAPIARQDHLASCYA